MTRTNARSMILQRYAYDEFGETQKPREDLQKLKISLKRTKLN